METTVAYADALQRHPQLCADALAQINQRRARTKRPAVTPADGVWSYVWAKQIGGKGANTLSVSLAIKVGLQSGSAHIGVFPPTQTLMPEITAHMAPPPITTLTTPHAGAFSVASRQGRNTTELVVGGYARLGTRPGFFLLTRTLGIPHFTDSLYQVDGKGGLIGWAGGLRSSAEKAYHAAKDGEEWRWRNTRFQKLSFSDLQPLIPTQPTAFTIAS